MRTVQCHKWHADIHNSLNAILQLHSEPFRKLHPFPGSWFFQKLSSMAHLAICTQLHKNVPQEGIHIGHEGHALHVLKMFKLLFSCPFRAHILSSNRTLATQSRIYLFSSRQQGQKCSLIIFLSRNLMIQSSLHEVLVHPSLLDKIPIFVVILQYNSKNPSTYTDFTNIILISPSRIATHCLSNTSRPMVFNLPIVPLSKIQNSRDATSTSLRAITTPV